MNPPIDPNHRDYTLDKSEAYRLRLAEMYAGLDDIDTFTMSMSMLMVAAIMIYRQDGLEEEESLTKASDFLRKIIPELK